ncbi:hypothetical protein BH20CHL7_BH20CHL7_08690 [soil metagenome]
MATPTDAARDRVLAARAELEEDLQQLEASGRAAIDIPARIRRSPAKAAAAAGGLGFLALKGPQRLFRAVRRAVKGEGADLPDRMLPDEIEKTLRRLGDDGKKVRGALERDFAGYVRQAEKGRKSRRSALVAAAAMPLLTRGAKAAAEFLASPDEAGFSARLAQIRERLDREAAHRREADTHEDAPDPR